ncbi:MAG: hypothetical protein ACK41D_10095 [Rubricoccaceae bacterium]
MTPPDLLDRLLLAGCAFAAGLGLGLLLAPQPGARMRRELASRASEAAATAQSQARDLAEPLQARVRETARELSERHLPLADDWQVVDRDDILRDLRYGRS